MSQLGNLSPEASVAVGVIACLLSSGIQSLGLTLQRKSHMLEETHYLDSPRPPYRRRRWQVGFSLFLIANLVGSTIQLSILPLPVLAALQAAGLVFNSINATWILGEDFTRWSFAGTILVTGGALLIAYFGALPEPAHSLGQLLSLFARKPFIAWAVAQSFLILSIFGIIYLMRRLSKSRGQGQKMRLARGMCFGALSGILSAHSLLMAKSAVELLVRTIVDGENQFAYWQSWIILLALVCIGLSQLYCLHSGLQLCSTSVLYPFVFCVYNVITILDGLIYFNQSSQLSDLDTGLIVLGTLILLSGVFCLSWRLAAEDVSGPEPSASGHTSMTGTPKSSSSERGGSEAQPLLGQSSNGEDESSMTPFTFRPRRANESVLDDEEAGISSNTAGDRIAGEGAVDGTLRLLKTRKRATFADFGTMNKDPHRARSSTNPISSATRRSSVLSLYARTKNRRISTADSRALWGELEESDGPGVPGTLSRSELFGAGYPAASHSFKDVQNRRRMSEGSGNLFSRPSLRSSLQRPLQRSSDAHSDGRPSTESGIKHEDPGRVAEDEELEDMEEDPMASSLPLLHRAGTGRIYRVLTADTRRRRSSVPEGSRHSAEMRRRLREERGDAWTWHTIDASGGRPSDDESAGGEPPSAGPWRRSWNNFRSWFS